MYVEVWERIKDILDIAKTGLATQSITLTVPETIPRGAQDYDGFFAVVGLTNQSWTSTRSPVGAYTQRDNVFNWPIDVFAPSIFTQYDYKAHKDILTVADTIFDTFAGRSKLESGTDALTSPLQYVSNAEPASGTLPDVQPYPQGSNDYRWHWSMVLVVEYIWICPDKRV